MRSRYMSVICGEELLIPNRQKERTITDPWLFTRVAKLQILLETF